MYERPCRCIHSPPQLLGAAGDWPELEQAAVAAGHAQSRGLDTDSSRRRPLSATDDADGADEDKDEWEEGSDGGYYRAGNIGALGDKSQQNNLRRVDGLSFMCPMVGNTIVRLHGKMSQR